MNELIYNLAMWSDLSMALKIEKSKTNKLKRKCNFTNK